MPLRLLHDGSAFKVLAYARTSDTSQVETYLEGLIERERKRMTALLGRMAQYGAPRNREKSAAVASEDFFEFKAYQQRIFWCYAPGKRVILFYGFTKKSNETPKNAIDAGRRIREEVREATRNLKG